MKTIYNFKQRIKEDPEYIRKAHELTLNTTKPKAGLKGTYGLLGSKEWWDNLENGSIPQKEISGTIKKVYLTGQDNTEDFNTIDIETENKTLCTEALTQTRIPTESITKQEKNHHKICFRPTKKPKPNGDIDYSKIVVEILISE